MTRPIVKSRSASSGHGLFKVVEVGARDGLQNEKMIVSTDDKVRLIDSLADCGLKTIEATSFVSPKWVPQMADHAEVMKQIKKRSDVAFPVLVPNLQGLKSALAAEGVSEIAVFTAASEAFSKKNTNCSIDESLQRIAEVVQVAKQSGRKIRIRGYISCVIGCPYEGKIEPKRVAEVAQRLDDYGCYEVSLGDTIGVGSAGSMTAMLDEVLKVIPGERLAVHCHDTFGQALANVLVAIQKGIRTADSSIAGLGGCPYAKGATGNLATEDLVYMLHDLGFETGIDLSKLLDVSQWICGVLKTQSRSRAGTALVTRRCSI